MDIKVKILSADELFALAEEPPNDDLFGSEGYSRRIEFLNEQFARHEIHITALMGGRIVGICALQQDDEAADKMWFKFVAVEDEHSGEGIGTMLLKRAFAYVLEHNLKLHLCSFTPQGKQRIRHKFLQFRAEHSHATCTTCQDCMKLSQATALVEIS